jgi:hypothetical protein
LEKAMLFLIAVLVEIMIVFILCLSLSFISMITQVL